MIDISRMLKWCEACYKPAVSTNESERYYCIACLAKNNLIRMKPDGSWRPTTDRERQERERQG